MDCDNKYNKCGNRSDSSKPSVVVKNIDPMNGRKQKGHVATTELS